MTEKLYYRDAYIREFNATVLSVTAEKRGYCVLLDKTAFFPEEGGQSADTGYIGDSRVFDARELDGEIYHYTDSAPAVGECVPCRIDFGERLEKMKLHTAEHILCGVFHGMGGYENVGFHLSGGTVVFDINAVLTADEIDEAELAANRIVAENAEVRAYFPSENELSGLSYRSKLELTENVRIVEIGDYDRCACCAPHVARTGEIGLIKILSFEKHRGGTRITMVAGESALLDYRARCVAARRISALTSTPQADIADAVEALRDECETLRAELKAKGLLMVEVIADGFKPTEGNAVLYHPQLNMDELRELAKLLTPRIGGILVALGGEAGDYKYVISSGTVDLRARAKEINAALSGRGGGRPEMLQGTFAAPLDAIREYFI